MTENGTDPPSLFASTLNESVPTETVGLTTSTKRRRLLTWGGWGKSGQGQIGPLVYINVTFEMNIGIKL